MLAFLYSFKFLLSVTLISSCTYFQHQLSYLSSYRRNEFGVNTDYVKVPLFPILLIISPISLLYFPILCKC